jgi:hypothetical protein
MSSVRLKMGETGPVPASGSRERFHLFQATPRRSDAMAVIRFGCPRCHSILEADESKAGFKIACPKCQQKLQIPLPAVSKTILAPLVPAPSSPVQNGRPPVAIPVESEMLPGTNVELQPISTSSLLGKKAKARWKQIVIVALCLLALILSALIIAGKRGFWNSSGATEEQAKIPEVKNSSEIGRKVFEVLRTKKWIIWNQTARTTDFTELPRERVDYNHPWKGSTGTKIFFRATARPEVWLEGNSVGEFLTSEEGQIINQFCWRLIAQLEDNEREKRRQEVMKNLKAKK